MQGFAGAYENERPLPLENIQAVQPNTFVKTWKASL